MLFNIAMITLDVQPEAHQTQMEVKQEQTAFLNAADSSESGEKVGAKLVAREYPTLSLGLPARFLTDQLTELEGK
eukprot:2875999-Rhodomonas_salina.1